MPIETLNTDGYLFTEIAGEYRVLTADFGDGYGSAALIGSPEGTRTWSMRIDVLPDAISQGAMRVSDGLEPSFLLTEDGGYLLTEEGARMIIERESTRAAYLWRFFRVSKAAGDAPFWIELEDPDEGVRKMFLASFADHKLSYQQLCARVYATGLTMRQRRLPGVPSPVSV